MPGDWSLEEVKATVADYFAMLGEELRGEPLNKTAHRRQLLKLLNDRSSGAVERKHQNISAVLLELGYPYVDGYKPLRNYQYLLFKVVEDRLAGSPDLVRLISDQVVAPVGLPEVKDILSVLEEPPARSLDRRRTVYERPNARPGPTHTDYLAREARNFALGTAGEEFVIEFEKARLIHAGLGQLAERVEHTAVTEGPSAGFDIRSFNANGSDRLIEVKTTGYGKHTPFYVTRNEVETSNAKSDSYALYRAYKFRDAPKLFMVDGALAETCLLDPVQYVGRVA